jgi:hypothetical protein
MSAVNRRDLLASGAIASIGLFLLAACSLEPDRQWYKPNQNYTSDELRAQLRRDYTECTKNKVLDEACMRQRGWVSLTGDREPPARSTPPSSRTITPRY